MSDGCSRVSLLDEICNISLRNGLIFREVGENHPVLCQLLVWTLLGSYLLSYILKRMLLFHLCLCELKCWHFVFKGNMVVDTSVRIFDECFVLLKARKGSCAYY